MNYLVTGGAGFIGANFVYHLLDRHPDCHVVVLDKLTYAGNRANLAGLTPDQESRMTFVQGDIGDRDCVAGVFDRWELHAVLNFAAETHVDRSIEDPAVFLKTNVMGTHTLLEACLRQWRPDRDWVKDRRFLQVSTDEVYGSLGPEGFFTEDSPLDPHSPYSASKASADLLVGAYHDTYGLPVVITRCSNNYGPYQFPEKLIPLMIRNALRHEPLPVYGDGLNVRDWIYVGDHCRAIDRVLESGRDSTVYNIGGNNEHENIGLVRRIVAALARITGDPGIDDGLIRFVEDRAGHDRRYAIDSTRIREELGWEPRVDFDQGLEQTIRWYVEHGE